MRYLADTGSISAAARDDPSTFPDEEPHGLEPDATSRPGDKTRTAAESQLHRRLA